MGLKNSDVPRRSALRGVAIGLLKRGSERRSHILHCRQSKVMPIACTATSGSCASLDATLLVGRISHHGPDSTVWRDAPKDRAGGEPFRKNNVALNAIGRGLDLDKRERGTKPTQGQEADKWLTDQWGSIEENVAAPARTFCFAPGTRRRCCNAWWTDRVRPARS
jgi:hypothetical protein